MSKFNVLLTLTLVMTLAAVAAPVRGQEAETPDTVKNIAVITTYYGARSHANALATMFFTGYPTDEGIVKPKLKVVSMYVDQSSPDDMAHRLAERYDFKVWPTITEALTLGTEELAVDGVIYIGVHGKYPRSQLGAKMYPHMRHLEEVFTVFDSSGRSVPVYCDKELGYSWLDTQWIYKRAQELDVPMMAGSTLPVVWRDPQIPTPQDEKITEAVAVGYGPLNSYLLHTVEILQSMIERRAGGETGVASVQCLRGPAVLEAAREGRFSLGMVQAACDEIEGKRSGTFEENASDALAILITYRDGTKATAVSVGRYVDENFAFAVKTADGSVATTEYVMPHNTVFPHFSYLFFNVERMMLTGRPAWPIERNVIGSGIIDAAMRSAAAGGELLETPHLHIEYQATGPEPIRPTNPQPTGQSLGPWPPKGLEFTTWGK